MAYLGLDAGATKTHVLLAGAQGQALALGAAGCGNWEMVGLEGARIAWRQALDAALNTANLAVSEITASAFGLSGLDWPSDELPLAAEVAKLGLPGPEVLVNDAFIALRAGITQTWGVVVLAGTGSTKAGRSRAGQTARTLGLGGRDWGDWGGGAAITEMAIAKVARAYASMGPPTRLSEMLPDFAGLPDAESLLKAVTRGGTVLKSATHLVFEAAAAGDEPARAVLRQAGHGLAEGTVYVIRELAMEAEDFELVLAGSVFKAEEPLMVETLLADVRVVAPHARPVRLTAPPAVGAVLLAMEADGLTPGEHIRARLLQGADALCL